MSFIQDAERLELRLTPDEKVRLLQSLALDLSGSWPGVESLPGVCGGEPCIVRTRIPVWVLEQARRLGQAEADILRSYPTLRAQDLVNAWGYVLAHREEIDWQIQENEAA